MTFAEFFREVRQRVHSDGIGGGAAQTVAALPDHHVAGGDVRILADVVEEGPAVVRGRSGLEEVPEGNVLVLRDHPPQFARPVPAAVEDPFQKLVGGAEGAQRDSSPGNDVAFRGSGLVAAGDDDGVAHPGDDPVFRRDHGGGDAVFFGEARVPDPEGGPLVVCVGDDLGLLPRHEEDVLLDLLRGVGGDALVAGRDDDLELGNSLLDEGEGPFVEEQGSRSQTVARSVDQPGSFGVKEFHLIDDDAVVVLRLLLEGEAHVDVFDARKGRDLEAELHVFPLPRELCGRLDGAARHEFVAVAEDPVADAQGRDAGNTLDLRPEDEIFPREGPGLVAENVEVLSGHGVALALDLPAVHGQRRGLLDEDVVGALDPFQALHIGLVVHRELFGGPEGGRQRTRQDQCRDSEHVFFPFCIMLRRDMIKAVPGPSRSFRSSGFPPWPRR